MNCSKCGVCCKLFLIDLDEEEYHSGKYKTIFQEHYDNFNEALENAANIVAQNKDGSCIYLNNGLCSIHNWRPKACRNFFCDSSEEKDQKKIKIINKYKNSKKNIFFEKKLTFNK